MKKALYLIISVALFSLFTCSVRASEVEEREQAIREALFVASSVQPKLLRIGLVDCLAYTLKNNSEIKIQKIEPLISRQDVKIAEAEFDPTLTFESSLEDDKVEVASALAGSHTRTGEFNFGIDGKFSSGTEYSFDFLNKKHKSNSTYLTINPYYESEFGLTITQPLFKDFGSLVNRADIIIASNHLEKLNQDLKKDLIDLISRTKQTYYNYLLYIEKYKTAQISLARAEDLLEIIQKRQAKGLASSIDLLEAKTGVAERQDLLLAAERATKDAEDEVKYVTNIINDPQLWHAQIEPLDRPEVKEIAAGLIDSLRQAFEYRPDYEAAKIELKNQDVRILVKENSVLPTVDLVSSFGLNGLASDYDAALKADYKKWDAGVKVSFPWGLKEEKAGREKAYLIKKQLLISFERLQQKIILEVRNAVRAVDTAREKTATAEKRVETETARYAAIEQRFREGLVNTHDMLEYQEDLSSAETGYIQSLIDYAQSQIELEKTTGVTLVKNNIILEE